MYSKASELSFNNKFANLGHPNRIWTVSAIHGEHSQLVSVHRAVFDRFAPGDKLVYTGNYLGSKYAKPLETLDELIHYRSALVQRYGVPSDDVVFLRGVQEELFTKLQQLQFAPNPPQVVEWMTEKYPELDSILRAYDSSLAEAARTAREGILNLTRWSNTLKARIRAENGHENFFSDLRRAAFTEHKPKRGFAGNDNPPSNILFVHAGIDPARSLDQQGDSFWWASKNFNVMEPFLPFKSVVRGHDPELNGVHRGKACLSLAGNCGYGGKLVCAQLTGTGEILEILAA